MTLQAFIDKYSNPKEYPVGDTDANLGQCVGLVEVWTDLLGLPHTWGNAKDLPANADRKAYDVFTAGTPQPGDIFCFDGFYGEGVGHTGIVAQATPTTVTLFQQNDPGGSIPHLKTYSYAHTVGWIHPKKINPTEEPMDKDTVEFMYLAATDNYPTDDQYSYWTGRKASELAHALYTSNADFRFKANNYDDLQTQIRSQVNTIDELNADNAKLTEQLAAAAKQTPTPPETPPTTDQPSQENQANSSIQNTTAWLAGLKAWLKNFLGIK